MKWILLLSGMVVVVLASFGRGNRFGVRLGSATFAWSPERFELEDRMRRFLEDLQFKDFVHAATLHTQQDREGRDIGKLIESKFHIKPELLDVKGFEVLRVDLMSTGERAKVLTKVQVKLLNAEEKPRELESVFYFKKNEGVWYMDLQSSL